MNTHNDLRTKARIRAEIRRRLLGVPVRVIKPLKERLEENSSPIPECGCVVWLGSTTHSGHGEIGNKGKVVRVHRAAWEIANGAIPNGMSVLHRCDVPSCINPLHLFLGTQRDNMQDMRRKGRNKKGSSHYLAKITEQDVLEIRRSDCDLKTIAKKHGIATSTACQIRNGKQWGHVLAEVMVGET